MKSGAFKLSPRDWLIVASVLLIGIGTIALCTQLFGMFGTLEQGEAIRGKFKQQLKKESRSNDDADLQVEAARAIVASARPGMTQSEQICHGGSRSAEGGHYQAALVQFSQALAAVDREHKTDSRRKPDRYRINKAYVYQNRGYVYLQLHDYGRGIADLTEAIKLRPTYKTNYLNRARAYDLTGQKAAADADRAKAASLPADRDDDVPKSRVDVGQALEGADFVLGGGDKKKH